MAKHMSSQFPDMIRPVSGRMQDGGGFQNDARCNSWGNRGWQNCRRSPAASELICKTRGIKREVSENKYKNHSKLTSRHAAHNKVAVTHVIKRHAPCAIFHLALEAYLGSCSKGSHA